jgi:hypothetical protein
LIFSDTQKPAVVFFHLIRTALNRDTYNSLETGWLNFATVIVVLFFPRSLYVVAMANYKGLIWLSDSNDDFSDDDAQTND